jgi:hypothetical protein
MTGHFHSTTPYLAARLPLGTPAAKKKVIFEKSFCTLNKVIGFLINHT